MSRINKVSSPYYTTPIKDFYLDLWNAREIPVSANDYKMILESKYDKRPDTLAQDIYGSPRLWWVFAARNKDILVDPIEDFVAGLEIIIPSAQVVETLS
jgi:hypothetical protein